MRSLIRFLHRRPELSIGATAALVLLAAAACGGSPSSSPAGSSSSLPVTAPSQSSSGLSSSPASSRTTSHGAASPRAHASGCNPTLWSHVYHPYRLHLVSRCKTVRGTVEEVRWEPDGDLHILLAVSRSLVNSANVSYEHGDLVLEVICQGTITQADAVAACRGLHQHVTIPSVGDKAKVWGSYVLDADHGWMEIHPVSHITVTGHVYIAPAPTAPAPPPPSSAPPAQAGCYPKTPSGNCYEPGEFCSSAQHGETGVAGDGKTITCANTDPGSTWHWV
jgi:hypothetical protein